MAQAQLRLDLQPGIIAQKRNCTLERLRGLLMLSQVTQGLAPLTPQGNRI